MRPARRASMASGRAEARDRRLRSEPAGFDRVVDALQRGHVHEPGAVSGDQQAGRVHALRHGDEAAFGDGLRAPADPLAAGEDPSDERVGLQLLEEVVGRNLHVAVVEPDDHPDGDHVVAHRVDERTPNSRYWRPPRSGQPIVWMTRWSGFGTFQISLTPSAQTCGFSPARPNRSIATPVRCPCVPSARTVTLAVTSEPGSKFGSGSPSRPRPLSPVRTPTALAPSTSSFSADVSGRM